jgi:hypothetical protein
MDIHWTNIACTAITVACIGAGEAQIITPSLPALQPPPAVSTKGAMLPMQPSTLPFHAVIKAAPDPKLALGRPAAQPIVLQREYGGSIDQHRFRFATYQRDGSSVELRGSCYSACTLLTSYVPKDRLCVAPGAFLAFHSAQTSMDNATAQKHPYATVLMYLSYPSTIRDWIDKQGGTDKLPGPGQGYWTMYDRDLWAMGYPRCP